MHLNITKNTVNKILLFYYLQPGATVHESAVLLNSMAAEGACVGEKSVLSHTYLSVPVTIGKDCMMNGVYTIGLKVCTIHLQG